MGEGEITRGVGGMIGCEADIVRSRLFTVVFKGWNLEAGDCVVYCRVKLVEDVCF